MGIIKKTKIKFDNTIWGDDLNLIKYEIGSGDPYVYIQGGIHGGETTYWIFHELAHRLKDTDVKKKITLVPIVNPFSWNQKSYYYTFGKYSNYDGKDFNRNYPGNINGSSGERLAHAIYTEASKSKYSIDLHTANRSDPYLIVGKPDDKEIAKVMNLEHTFFFDFKGIAEKAGGEPLTYSLIKLGKEAIAMECGSHDVYDKTNINNCVQSIINYLHSIDAIEGHTKIERMTRYFSTSLKKYLAPFTGFVEYVQPLSTYYEEGTLLFKLYPSDNIEQTIDVYAEEDGYLSMQSPTHIVAAGDYVVEIIPKSSLSEIK